MNILICRIKDKSKIEAIRDIPEEHYDEYKESIKLAEEYKEKLLEMPAKTSKQENIRNEYWNEANIELQKKYPYLSISTLLREYDESFVIEKLKLEYNRIFQVVYSPKIINYELLYTEG